MKFNILNGFSILLFFIFFSACSSSDPTPPPQNIAPVANAGRIQNVATGTLVNLDGSESNDADRDALTYSWSIQSKPESSSATLTEASTSHPKFTPEVDGEYVIQLTVNDGSVDSAPSSVKITASTGNVIPVAHAGADQNVVAGTQITLDGSTSSDANGDDLTFLWAIATSPAGSTAALSDATSSHPTFTADVEGSYLVTLIVNDGTVASSKDTVQLIATHVNQNAVPVANAGVDRSVHTGTPVTLDASGSYDPDGTSLTYSWHISSLPAGSLAALSDTTIVNPMITPDFAGAYVLSLVVHDGEADSQMDFVTIQATTFSAKEQLINMGVDPMDADYLIANHSDDVNTVLNDQDRIFKDMPALDNMFALPSDPAAVAFTDPQMTNWSAENKIKFKKMFGRFVFVINSPKFKDAFDANIALLNPAYQGQAPALPFPANYSQFRADANAALVQDQYQYKFFISERESWTAWGQAGLHLKVENIMFGPPTVGAPHNTEALILHEITHTWGYAHDGPANEVTLKPNNIPYYVQFLVGSSYKDPAAALVWDTPDALLTIYFGNP